MQEKIEKSVTINKHNMTILNKEKKRLKYE